MTAVTASFLLEDYRDRVLAGKAAGTVDGYLRHLRRFLDWLEDRADGEIDTFDPDTLTREAVHDFLQAMAAGGYSTSQRVLARAAISGFSTWLIDARLLDSNPTRGLPVERELLRPARVLTPEQRRILFRLVERDGTARSTALFAFGYWAGCRVSDVSWLSMPNVHLTPGKAVVTVGYKNRKLRAIELCREAREALAAYLERERGDTASAFVFLSQRADRLTESGIHHWFRRLKTLAAEDEYPLICDLTYHDLRHDFAHRAREAGWSLEEVAFYLGHTNAHGWLVVGATARYTMPVPLDVFAKLPDLSELVKGYSSG